MSSHDYHRSVIFFLFFLYFGSTGFPSVSKLSLTSGSTTWSDFSCRTTITFDENPAFEIGLELNSPFEFCTAYSTNNRADSLHRMLLSYRQNRNDAKIYLSVRAAILTLVRKFKRGKRPFAYYSNQLLKMSIDCLYRTPHTGYLSTQHAFVGVIIIVLI